MLLRTNQAAAWIHCTEHRRHDFHRNALTEEKSHTLPTGGAWLRILTAAQKSSSCGRRGGEMTTSCGRTELQVLGAEIIHGSRSVGASEANNNPWPLVQSGERFFFSPRCIPAVADGR